MSVELDSGTPHLDVRTHQAAPDSCQLQAPQTAPANLTLSEAAAMLEEGLCRLIARGLSDKDFWRSFATLHDHLAADLADRERARLAFHADYALARMGLPAWTVMQQQSLGQPGSDPAQREAVPRVAAAA